MVCEYPGKPWHGAVSGTFPARFRGMVTFTYVPGFELQGEEAMVCTALGWWSGTLLRCEHEQHVSLNFLSAA